VPDLAGDERSRDSVIHEIQRDDERLISSLVNDAELALAQRAIPAVGDGIFDVLADGLEIGYSVWATLGLRQTSGAPQAGQHEYSKTLFDRLGIQVIERMECPAAFNGPRSRHQGHIQREPSWDRPQGDSRPVRSPSARSPSGGWGEVCGKPMSPWRGSSTRGRELSRRRGVAIGKAQARIQLSEPPQHPARDGYVQ